MIIGLNGKCIREEEAVVSVFDHGFLYGIGLFETFRTYEGTPFLLERHLARLADGCGQLGIAYEPSAGNIRRHLRELLDANGLTDGYVRFSVSAGVQPLGLPAGEYAEPNVIVYIKQLPAAGASEGKALQLLKLRRNCPEGSATRMKSFHYMNNVLAKREMSAYPRAEGAEGLFLDQRGYAAEGIVSNLFFSIGDRVYTPSLETGILPGITRGHVIELATEAGLFIDEGLYKVDRLTEADEIWMTGSVQEIVPIHTIYNEEGNPIWTSKSGRLTEKLAELYRKSVQVELARIREEDMP